MRRAILRFCFLTLALAVWLSPTQAAVRLGVVAGASFSFEEPTNDVRVVMHSMRLNRALNDLLAGPLPKRLANEGADPIGGTAKEFSDYLQSELLRWAEVVRAANIKVD